MRHDRLEKIAFAGGVLLLVALGWWQTHRSGIRPSSALEGTVSQAGASDRSARHEVSEASVSPSSSEKPLKQIFVHVEGEVNRPGVYRLGEGARVSDALDAAGGLTEQGDASRLNLAKRVTDEMKLTVRNREQSELSVEGSAEAVTAAQEDRPGADASAMAERGSIDINTAPVEVLLTLPGIGEARAKAIIAYRERHPFKSIDELMQIDGIGKKIFEKLKDRLSID